MKAPSKKLKAIASQEIPDMQEVLVQWGEILEKLEITSHCLLRPDVYGLLKDKFPDWSEFEETEKEEPLFLLTVCKTLEDFLRFKDHGRRYDNSCDLGIEFFSGNSARIKSSGKFLGQPCGMQGTWEEVARKLFEFEKLMLAQVPEVPGDLKS